MKKKNNKKKRKAMRIPRRKNRPIRWCHLATSSEKREWSPGTPSFPHSLTFFPLLPLPLFFFLSRVLFFFFFSYKASLFVSSYFSLLDRFWLLSSSELLSLSWLVVPLVLLLPLSSIFPSMVSPFDGSQS